MAPAQSAAAGESLLRELRQMRGGTSIPAPESIRKPAISSRFPAPTGAPPQATRYVVDSSLGALIDELAGGQGMQRWASVRLREALEEEVAGNFMQAVAILQVVLAQFEDVRIRKERDRLQERGQQATSGIYRSRAIQAERSQKPKEAADQWRKVLEAMPNDVDAALHAATCLMEVGDLKQAAQFARKAVQLAPDNLQAHKLLYKFFQRTGMEASAAREREIILKLRKA
jgi:Tfp pilus assembly protein PilF